jgi:hypothetical protein
MLMSFALAKRIIVFVLSFLRMRLCEKSDLEVIPNEVRNPVRMNTGFSRSLRSLRMTSSKFSHNLEFMNLAEHRMSNNEKKYNLENYSIPFMLYTFLYLIIINL